MKTKLIKIFFYVLLFISLSIGLTFAIFEIHKTVSSLRYKLIVMFEEELKTKVNIEKVSGDLTKKLVLENVTIFHQFRSDKKLAVSKSVEIHFNLVKAILRERITIRNISKIVVNDFDLYVDEDFGRLTAVRVMVGKDDGKDNGPKNLSVILPHGRIHSIFKNSKNGKFNVQNVGGYFKKVEGINTFKARGYFIGNKVYGNTKSNFVMTGNDSIKEANMRGILSFASINYLGYNFRGISCSYLITNERIKFKIDPTIKSPFSIPKKRLISYKSSNPYNYLLNLKFDYIINEDDYYINVKVDKESHAVKKIFLNFLKENFISRLKNIKTNNKTNNKNFKTILKSTLLNIRNTVDQPYGKALFRIYRGKLYYSIQAKVNNVISTNDKLSANINGTSDIINFDNLKYNSIGGDIRGKGTLLTKGSIKSLSLKIENLKPNIIFPTVPENTWRIRLSQQISLYDNTIDEVNLTKMPITGNIEIKKSGESKYSFSFYELKIGEIKLPNISGITILDNSTLYSNFYIADKYWLRVMLKTNIEKLDYLNYKLAFRELEYSLVKDLFNLNVNLDNPIINIDSSGCLNLKNIKKSISSARIKIYYPKTSFSKHDVLLDNQHSNSFDKELDISCTNLEDLTIRKTSPINYSRWEQSALIDVKFKNGVLFVNDSYINNKDIRFKGQISFSNKYIYPEFRVSYLGLALYFDGYFSKLKNSYHTKLNFVYDDFKHQWTSVTGYLKPDGHNLMLKDFVLRHNKQSYNIGGYVGHKDNRLAMDIALKSVMEPNLSYNLRGSLYARKINSRTTFYPNLSFQYGNELPITLDGSIALEKANIIPNIAIKYMDDKYRIKGSISKVINGIDSQLEIICNKEKFILLASFNERNNLLYGNIILKGKDRNLSIMSVIGEDKKNRINTKIDIRYNEYNSLIHGNIYIKGDAIVTDLFIQGENQKVHIDGYVNHIDRYYFPVFKISYYPDSQATKGIPYYLTGRIEEFNSHYDINGIINNQLIIKGKYTKYSFLSLNLFFDDFIFLTSNLTPITISNKHSHNGIKVDISPKGLTSFGDITIKDIYGLAIKGIGVETNFSYNIPFGQEKQTVEMILYSFKLTKNDSKIFDSTGNFHYRDNIWKVNLEGVKKKSSLKIAYNSNTEVINSIIRFNKFDLRNLDKDIQGSLNGEISIKGDINNPELLSPRITVEKGSYSGVPFLADLSIKKTDRLINIANGYFKIGDSALQVKNIKYSLKDKPATIEEYFNKLHANSSLSIDSIVFYWKKIKFKLDDVKYSVGDRSLSIKKDSYFLPLLLFSNSDNMLTFREGNISFNKSIINIDKFSFSGGKNWNIDMDVKLKLFFLENKYLADLAIFGGRNEKYGEVNLISNYSELNGIKHPSIELLAKAEGSKWRIWSNTFNIKGGFQWLSNLISYNFNYIGKDINFNSKGRFDFDNNNMDTLFQIQAGDISLYSLPLLFKKAGGTIISDIHIVGNWANPKIKGYFKIKNGLLHLHNQDNPVENINIDVKFNKDKTYAKTYNNEKVYFNNQIKASAEYNEGNVNAIGYFDISKWRITAFDFNIKTPKKMNLDIEADIAQYKGFINAKLHLYGNQKEAILDGKVYLSDGEIGYIGSRRIKSIKKTFLTTINLDVLELIIEDDVKANIGSKNLSIGEIILKEGSRLKIRKKLEDLKDDKLELDGIIESKKGEFYYLGHSFRVISSKLILSKGQKTQIELKAETKVRDENNRLVSIFLKLKGNVDDLNDDELLSQSLYASPSKSPREIALLLGGEAGERERRSSDFYPSSRGSVSKPADVALNLALIRPIERKLKEIFGIDTFNIKQKFIKNTFLRDPSIDEYGLPTKVSRINPISDTEITIGKYITKDIYASTGLLLLQDIEESADTKKIWKFGLELDLLPLLTIESETVKLQLSSEYRFRQDYQDDKHEGIFKLQINIEF